MQTSVVNYFWLVDHLSIEDNPNNKVNAQTETVSLSEELHNQIKSGSVVQALLEKIHLTYIKRTEQAFPLKPISSNNPQERWDGLFAQIEDFGI